MSNPRDCALSPSHGECSDTAITLGGWVRISAAVSQGVHRATMEDRVLVTSLNGNGETFAVVVVLDGHGGSETVDFVFTQFKSALQASFDRFGADIRKCLLHTFYLLDTGVEVETSGTTVSCLLINLSSRVSWLASVGDSSVYGVKNLKGTKLSVDHNLKNPSEVARIKKLADFHGVTRDGYVCNANGDMLNMTRAIGDHNFGDIVIAKPAIKKVTDFDIIVLATDGIWDVLDINKVIELVPGAPDWKKTASHVNDARNMLFSQHDNTSIVVIFMNPSIDDGI